MIIGHQFQWQYLKKMTEMGKIPHAFLFSGPKQVGKRGVAIEFVKLLFGSENHQSIEKGIHPDLTIVEPGSPPSAKASESRQIQISQIRKLNSYFNLRHYSAPFKIAIIDEAHRMNTEAQSSFLKLLEEPKGKTIFILITPFPKMLLPTILSRVQIIKFYRVSNLEIKKYLKSQNITEKKINEIVDFCDGRPGRAIDFLASPQKLEKEKEKLQEIIKLTNSDLAFRFQYAKKISDSPQDLVEILNLWLKYFRKILLLKIKNLQPITGSQVSNYSLSKLKKILRLIQDVNFLISTTNVNPRLALEILMLEL